MAPTPRMLRFYLLAAASVISRVTCHNACTRQPCEIDVLEIPPEDTFCAMYSTCETQHTLANLSYYEINCFCDPLCAEYGDCCRDSQYLSERPEENRGFSVLPTDVTDCQRTDLIDTDYHDIYMVGSCPVTWGDADIESKCRTSALTQDLMLKWPVSDATGILFSNVYCGVCNGRQPAELKYWAANFSCEDFTAEAPDINHLLRDGRVDDYCTLKFVPSDEHFGYRYCKMHVGYCSPGWTNFEVASQCEGPLSYTSIVYGRMYNYKNRFCAMCNHDMDFTCQQPVPNFAVGLSGNDYYDNNYKPRTFPISLLLDLNSGFGKYGSSNARVGAVIQDLPHNATSMKLATCPSTHVYDPFTAACRLVSCSKGFVQEGDHCVNPDSQDEGTYHTAVNQTADCLRHLVNSSEYVTLADGIVYINSSNTSVQSTEYVMQEDGSLLVCTHLSQNYSIADMHNANIKFNQVQTWVSLVGQVVSLVALALHFLVYCWLPALRNLAGRNLMCLVGALFTAQLLFLVGVARTEVYAVCALLAALTHYSFLAAFTWMSVMSYDIFRTFSSSHAPTTDRHGRRFLQYSLYAWAAPAIVVLAALVVNFSTGPDTAYRPGYGETVCWLTYRLGLIVFFGVPVFIVIATNTTLFILTTVSICRVTAATKMVNKTSDKQRLILYAKLSTIMGLTWIFGFIATLADVPSLWYLFIILNSLQGAFIFIAFVCNKKTLGMLKSKYRRIVSESSKTTDSYATKSSLLTHSSKGRSQSFGSESGHHGANNVGNNYIRQESTISTHGLSRL